MIHLSPSGSADDTAQINAAIVQAVAAGGELIMLSAGNWLVPAGSQIVWPADAGGVSLMGEGRVATKFVVAARSTDFMVITGMAAPNLPCIDLRRFGIFVGGQCTGGAMIHVTNVHDIVMEDILTVGPHYDAYVLDGGPGQYLATLTNLSTQSNQGSYRSLVLGASAAIEQGAKIVTCKFFGSEYGIWCGDVSGVDIVHTECLQHTQHGFVTYPLPGQTAYAMQITGLDCDSCGGTGVYVGTGGGVVGQLIFTDLFSNTNNLAMEIAQSVDGLAVIGYRFVANRSGKVKNYGSPNVMIMGGI